MPLDEIHFGKTYVLQRFGIKVAIVQPVKREGGKLWSRVCFVLDKSFDNLSLGRYNKERLICVAHRFYSEEATELISALV